MQTGDPTNTGKGGESIWGKKYADEFKPTLKHNVRGIVSMANSEPDTNGSQFFIAYAKHTQLDHVYTIFGKYGSRCAPPPPHPRAVRSRHAQTSDVRARTCTARRRAGRVIAGFDTLDALEKVTVDDKFRPVQDVKINSVVIHANPLADMA